jgi:hypothetical protein
MHELATDYNTALKPLGEIAFTEPPLGADLESGQFFLLDQPPHRSPGHLQQLGGFLECQQAYRFVMVFRRRFLGAQS